ncbi:MAG: NUDIX domain-containing protein [Candidatus Methylomirabilales bacterium]
MKRQHALTEWRVLKRSVAFSCPWYEITQEKIRLPTDQVIDYSYITIPPSVMVVPITADSRMVLLRQYRYPTRSFCYELPGGNTNRKSPLVTGKDELFEETGYRARWWRRLGIFHPYSGMSDEVCYVYLATDLTSGRPRLEDREFIQVVEVPIREVYRRVERNQIQDGMTLASLLLARSHLKEKAR